MNTKQNRVLIIGAGGAACRAAVAAFDAGAAVTMITKGTIGQSGATAYGVAEVAAFNVADSSINPSDSMEIFYQDILNAAQGMADPDVVRTLVERAPDSMKVLEKWGVEFEKYEGHYLSIQACFSSRSRSLIIRGHGEPILRALSVQIRSRGIRVVENAAVVKIVVYRGHVAGVIFLDDQGNLQSESFDAVVVATGGAGSLFERNLNPPDVCGDGYSLGYDAGAELTNLEFMQAGIGVSFPIENILNSWVWSSKPRLTNALGESFLDSYLPDCVSADDVFDAHEDHFPFSSSDMSKYLEVSVMSEILAGRGSPNGSVQLDLRHINADYLEALPKGHRLKTMWPVTADHLKSRGADPARVPLNIACFAHAINGGLKIDRYARTNLPGLFAAGEVAGGPHGADRLGGNMMVTCQVFGEIAGTSAAGHESGITESSWRTAVTDGMDQVRHQLGRDFKGREYTRRLAHLMQRNLLVIRSEQGLVAAERELSQIEQEMAYLPESPPNKESWEMVSRVNTAALMIEFCRFRRESRGSHFRHDFPHVNSRFDTVCNKIRKK